MPIRPKKFVRVIFPESSGKGLNLKIGILQGGIVNFKRRNVSLHSITCVTILNKHEIKFTISLLPFRSGGGGVRANAFAFWRRVGT